TTEQHSPVEVVGFAEAAQITAGADHTCVVITAKGEPPFWCWGNNEHGQLGDNTTDERHAPATVLYLAASSMLAAGEAHTCAVLHLGLVECWGDNKDGQLGDGTTADRHYPGPAFVEKEGQRVGAQLFADHLLGEPAVRIYATATSGLAASSMSLTPEVCKVDFNQIHLIGLGECEVES